MDVVGNLNFLLRKISNHSLSNPALENQDVFKKYRNADNRIMRAAKKFYFETVLTNIQSNLKKTSQFVQSAINKKVVVNLRLFQN